MNKANKKKKISSIWRPLLFGGIGILIFLLIWQAIVSFTKLGQFLPGPIDSIIAFVTSFFNEIGTMTMGGHIIASMLRVLIGYSLAAIVGCIVGLAMGASRIAEAIIKPIFEVLRPIPGIAWIPIAILWFGIGEISKVFLIFIATFVVIAANAYAGAQSVDQTLIGAAKMLGATKQQIFRTIIVPASIPQIFTGLQTGLSISWMVIVAAEMIRSEFGVGWVITAGSNTANMTQVIIGIIAIAIVGMVLATLLRKIEGKLCSWKER